MDVCPAGLWTGRRTQADDGGAVYDGRGADRSLSAPTANRVQGHMLVKELLLDRSTAVRGCCFSTAARELATDIQAILADEANSERLARGSRTS